MTLAMMVGAVVLLLSQVTVLEQPSQTEQPSTILGGGEERNVQSISCSAGSKSIMETGDST